MFVIIPVRDFLNIPFRQRIIYHYCSQIIGSLSQSDKGLFTSPLSNDICYHSNPTKDYVSFLSQRIPSLFQSDKWFFVIPITKQFISIMIMYYYQQYYLGGLLYYSSPTNDSLSCISKGFLYDPSPTKNYILLLSQRISLLFQSDRGLVTSPLSNICFISPVRQRILYYSSLKGFLQYSGPTKDSVLFLSQRILQYSIPTKGSLLFLSHTICLIIPVRQRILYYSFLKGFLHYSSPTIDS